MGNRLRIMSYTEQITAAAMALLETEFPAMVARLEQALGSKFQMSADQAEADFRAQVLAKLSEAEPIETGTNDGIKDINSFVRTEIVAITDALRTLETWLHFSVPQVSDGNNFGVEVVEFVCKRITEAKTATKAQLDEVKKYSQDRAGAWEKAVFPQSIRSHHLRKQRRLLVARRMRTQPHPLNPSTPQSTWWSLMQSSSLSLLTPTTILQCVQQYLSF